MSRTYEVIQSVRSLVPRLPDWQVYQDVATGEKPPWVVVKVSETGRDGAEDLHTLSHEGVLDIRMVARTGQAISIVADKLKNTLDGATPMDGRISRLVPDTDSGLYASELTDSGSRAPYLMRVLTWRFGWSA